MSVDQLDVAIALDGGDTVCLSIYAENGGGTLAEIDVAEAIEHSESPYQLKEGCSYEYELPPGYQLRADGGVVRPSRIAKSSRGRITPGIYVGTLAIDVVRLGETDACGRVALEVRSVKSGYRDDYRHMLEDIAERSVGLLMQHQSPALQRFAQTYAADAETAYQKFAFVQSIVDSAEFAAAIHRIVTSPVTNWVTRENSADVRRVGKLTQREIRQFASASNRLPLPAAHPLRRTVRSIPVRITIRDKRESVDTPENRFVKYVLGEFQEFCSDVLRHLKLGSRAQREATQLAQTLDNYLRHPLFKEVSRPTLLPINSPVLQRQAGYRELLRVWLMFELASKLTWQGGADVYDAGKRDVATLYEYWLFFKLLDLLQKIFELTAESTVSLIEVTEDTLGLRLRGGQHLPLHGVYDAGSRTLAVKFSYNRTFSGQQRYPAGGSWTKSMRPDYTLTLWPSEFDEAEAEAQELIIHVHFDAKYKVKNSAEILGSDDDTLDEEKAQQRKGEYKRADLLKMHAYKDAVRRTVGAYVLYPGTEELVKKGFHEVIPGLGAFPVRPSTVHDGTDKLEQFIKDIVQHFLDRSSQHERLSYHVYDIHKDENAQAIRESLPEYNAYDLASRAKPPDETSVLVGFCKDAAQHKWIVKNQRYNVRIGTGRGSLHFSPEAVGADYLLLHHPGETVTSELWKITRRGPRVISRDDMIKLDYPRPSGEFYSIYYIGKIEDDAFAGMQWDVTKLGGYKSGHGSGIPFAVTLKQLILAKAKDENADGS